MMSRLIEFANYIADFWSRWMIVSLAETAILLLLISGLWLAIRRWATPQLGFVLFLLVLVKPLVPISYSLPESVVGSVPLGNWLFFPAQEIGSNVNLSDGLDTSAEVRSREVIASMRPESARTTPGNSDSGNATIGLDGSPHSAQPDSDTLVGGASALAANRISESSAALAPSMLNAKTPETARLSIPSLLMFTWLSGLAVLIGMFVRSHYCFRRVIQRSVDCRKPSTLISDAAGQRFGQLLEDLTHRGYLPDRVEVRQTTEVNVPCVAGVIRPVILMPVGIVQSCQPAELEWIMLHELAHVYRRDLPIMLLQRVAIWLQYTNPFIWLADRRATELREYACDDCALSWSGSSPVTAGQAFLQVISGAAGSQPEYRSALRLASVTPQTSRKRRLARLLNSHRVKARLGLRDWLVILLIGFLLLPHWRSSPESLAAEPAATTEEVLVDSNQEEEFEAFELTVVGPEKQTLSNVEIEIRGRGPLLEDWIEAGSLERQIGNVSFVKTDQAGTLRLKLPPDRFSTFIIRHPGYAQYWAEWRNEPRPERFIAELGLGVSVGGVVVDEDGEAIEGAKISLGASFQKRPGDSRQLGQEGSVVTDPQGRWRFDFMPAEQKLFSVQVYHPDHAPVVTMLAVASHTLTGEQEPTEQLVMNAGLVVTGRVSDESGQPIEGAVVRAKIFREIRQATTDQSGVYHLTGCRPETTKIVVSAPGKAVDMRMVNVDSDMEPVDFVMQPGGSVRVRVIDQDEQPVPKARIVFRDWREPPFRNFEFENVSPFTDENGLWEWNEAPLDEFLADISNPHGMGLSRQTLKARDEEYVFQVHPPLVLSGRVIDAQTKQPIPEFQVTPGVREEASRLFWAEHETLTGRDGHFEFRQKYDYLSHLVKVQAVGYQVQQSREVKSHEGQVELLFELEPSPGIQVSVSTPTGEPAVGAKVALGIPDSQIRLENGQIDPGMTNAPQTDTNENGQFQFAGPATDYQLVIVHPTGYAYAKVKLDEPIDSIQLTAWAAAEGTYHIGGKPAAGVYLHLSSGDVESQGDGYSQVSSTNYTVTDQLGRYKFQRVFPGRGTVQNFSPMVDPGATELSSTTSKIVEFMPGETAQIDFGRNGTTVEGRILSKTKNSPEVTTHVDLEIESDTDTESPPFPTIYSATLDRDGNFRIDGMTAGDYVMTVRTFEKRKIVNRHEHKFSVPESAVDTRETVDLGEISIEVSRR